MSFTCMSVKYLYDYYTGDSTIARCNIGRLIGTFMNFALSLNVHVNGVVALSAKKLGLVIINCQRFTNVSTLNNLFVYFTLWFKLN